MMEVVRSWLIGVTGVAILAALADSLSPEGAVKRVGRLTGGLVLMLAMLTPILHVDVGDLMDATQWMGELAMAEQELIDGRNAELEQTVGEQYRAYIEEKAAREGIIITAEVQCTTRDGLLFPQLVTVCGNLDTAARDALIMWISADLGIEPKYISFEEDGT